MGEKLTKLTKAQRYMLEAAVREPSGNPWLRIGIRQRSGKIRMFEGMKARGWFDGFNRITDAGRRALQSEPQNG